jgi:hypothetical protein
MGCATSKPYNNNIFLNEPKEIINDIENELTPESYYNSYKLEDPVNFNNEKCIYKEL